MSSRTPVYLKELASQNDVLAFLIDGITGEQIEASMKDWQPFIAGVIRRFEREKIPHAEWPQHHHWDWNRKYSSTSSLLGIQWLGIERKKRMQGLMMLNKATHVARIGSEKGKPLVYIEYIATAPWNSIEMVKEPSYGRIGRIFISAAIQISQAEEFKGRIGLHSLPQSEKFYSLICGMTDLGADHTNENLRYFEMTPAQAKKFLE